MGHNARGTLPSKALLMNIDAIPIGKNPPDELNVIIEVPLGGEPIKYEIDKASGALFVDRFLYTPMRYPGNYGFVPHTLCGDGDPLDVLVLAPVPVLSGSVVRCRPVALLRMEDEAGEDAKMLAVPVSSTCRLYDAMRTLDDVPAAVLQQIEHFFAHYKDLEPGKFVKLLGWADVEEARAEVMRSVRTFADGLSGSPRA